MKGSILIKNVNDPTRLLQYLIQIQAEYSYISHPSILQLSEKLGLSPKKIESVVSFYSFLSLEPQGDYRILFSNNITDRMAGSESLYSQLNQAVRGLSVSMDYTSCTGLCDQGPAMLVNGWAINRLDRKRIEEIIELIKNRQAVDKWPRSFFWIEDNIQRRDIQFSLQANEGEALACAIALGRDETIDRIDRSGLRGRGGAGFRTGSKWKFCRQTKSDSRYVVCNADEGEPGTFKDRVLLHDSPHAVIEGMTICAWAIGAEKGFIYLRGEYLFLLEPLKAVINQRRQDGLLGQNIQRRQGFNFDIEIHLGAGAYICGEESALIESLQGKRGNPRIRPPFPVVEGYNNKPTVVNNVETFWSVSRILVKGSEWFQQAGTEQSSGTRLLSISGDCQLPGIYEYPFGITLKEILDDCGGSDAQAVQMAGAAGTTVLAKDFNRQMSFEDLATGGSFMVMGPQRDLMEMLENFANFFHHESCGFCTPCRVGTYMIADLIHRFRTGVGSRDSLRQLKNITKLMQVASFCGLGSSAPTVFVNALKDNSQLFENLIDMNDEDPVFDLASAVNEFKQLTDQ